MQHVSLSSNTPITACKYYTWVDDTDTVVEAHKPACLAHRSSTDFDCFDRADKPGTTIPHDARELVALEFAAQRLIST
jgi:hypothetical protein